MLKEEAVASGESRLTMGLGRLHGAKARREPASVAPCTQSGQEVPLVISLLCPRDEKPLSWLLWEPVGVGGSGGVSHIAPHASPS